MSSSSESRLRLSHSRLDVLFEKGKGESSYSFGLEDSSGKYYQFNFRHSELLNESIGRVRLSSGKVLELRFGFIAGKVTLLGSFPRKSYEQQLSETLNREVVDVGDVTKMEAIRLIGSRFEFDPGHLYLDVSSLNVADWSTIGFVQEHYSFAPRTGTFQEVDGEAHELLIIPYSNGEALKLKEYISDSISRPPLYSPLHKQKLPNLRLFVSDDYRNCVTWAFEFVELVGSLPTMDNYFPVSVVGLGEEIRGRFPKLSGGEGVRIRLPDKIKNKQQ